MKVETWLRAVWAGGDQSRVLDWSLHLLGLQFLVGKWGHSAADPSWACPTDAHVPDGHGRSAKWISGY